MLKRPPTTSQKEKSISKKRQKKSTEKIKTNASKLNWFRCSFIAAVAADATAAAARL